MKRKGFIAALLSIPTLPFLVFPSNEKSPQRKIVGFKVSAGEGK
ncbi:hypothetical protein [Arenibacter amylolyticus]|nr:hypothetical protein [Arenibacter amylolyticus]